ncbi:MAG: hypothetical protein AAF570_17825, partial [Bacteroidota bacterium]
KCSTEMVTLCWDGNTIKVSKSAEPAMLEIGAKRGPCPATTIEICHIPPSNPRAYKTMTIPISQWPTYQAQGAHKGKCSTKMVTLCWDGNTFQTSQSTVAAFKEIGATVGPCPTGGGGNSNSGSEDDPNTAVRITICEIPPANPLAYKTTSIKASLWPMYQKRGSVKGKCSPTKTKVCWKGKTENVSVTIWPYLQARGGTKGDCPSGSKTGGKKLDKGASKGLTPGKSTSKGKDK